MPQEEAQGVVLEERDHALRRREEVEAARGRGRVENEEVDVGIGRVLVQRLDAHVLEDAGQRVDESRVEAVLVDSLEASRGSRCVARRRSNVAFGSIWRARSRPPLGMPGALTSEGRLERASRAEKAEGLGEAPRGIDGEDEGAAPAARGRQAERGRERRLPDAPGSGEDDQLLAGRARGGGRERLDPGKKEKKRDFLLSRAPARRRASGGPSREARRRSFLRRW